MLTSQIPEQRGHEDTNPAQCYSRYCRLVALPPRLDSAGLGSSQTITSVAILADNSHHFHVAVVRPEPRSGALPTGSQVVQTETLSKTGRRHSSASWLPAAPVCHQPVTSSHLVLHCSLRAKPGNLAPTQPRRDKVPTPRPLSPFGVTETKSTLISWPWLAWPAPFPRTLSLASCLWFLGPSLFYLLLAHGPFPSSSRSA